MRTTQDDEIVTLDWPTHGIYVQTPVNLSLEQWDKLRTYIEILKPKPTPEIQINLTPITQPPTQTMP